MRTPRGTRTAFLLAAVIAALAWLGGGPATKVSALCAFNLLALGAVAVRAKREPRGHPSHHTLVGFSVYTVANIAFFLVPITTGRALPFPSLADAGLFLAYCIYLIQLRVVARRRVPVAQAGVDVAFVGLALTAPLWEFVVKHSLGSGLPLSATVATLMYPVMLTLLFAFALRLVFMAGYRGTPDLLLLGWVSFEFVANTYLAISTSRGSYQVLSPWFVALIASWACIGFLALSPAPSARTSAETEDNNLREGAPARLAFLAIALLAPTLTVGVEWIAVGDFAAYALAVAAVLSAAILARLSSVTVDLGRLQEILATLARLSSDLSHQVNHDSLTGLPNRVLLADRIELALEQRITGAGRGVVVLLLDLDDFKAINDSYGHEYGDALLIEVAAALSSACRAGDTVARLGGDEFAMVLPDANAAEALRLCDRLKARFQQPMRVFDHEVIVSVSVGIVTADGQDRSALLRQADIAMYAAKRAGGSGCSVFDEELYSDLLARFKLELELRGAVGRGELVLEYQPVMHLERHAMVAVEALVRWDHPEHGRIPPAAFIPLAEEGGSIRHLGDWVLETACRQLQAWDVEHPGSALEMAVNLSPRQLLDADLVSRVARVLDVTGVDPARITLEVTESALGGDTEQMIGKLHQLKSLGVRLAIDDFGTGYSSLSFLRRLPVDVLKVDKSFVDGIAREPEEWALTTAIIKLARSLGKQTLAEGVELGEQLAHLRALNCELAQGYLFDRPLPPAVISERLAAASGQRVST